MRYIFIDESGCAGFDFSKNKTSKHFVLAAVITEDKQKLDKIIKKVIRALPKKERVNHSGVLHCNKETEKTRDLLLKLLEPINFSIILINIRKKFLPFNDQKFLYHKSLEILYEQGIVEFYNESEKQNVGKFELFISKREKNKLLNKHYEEIFHNESLFNAQSSLKISIKSPAQEKSLQVADFISWCYFKNVEYQDNKYMKNLEKKIIKEVII